MNLPDVRHQEGHVGSGVVLSQCREVQSWMGTVTGVQMVSDDPGAWAHSDDRGKQDAAYDRKCSC